MSLNNLCGVYIHKVRKLVTYRVLPYNRGAVRLPSAVVVLAALSLSLGHAEPLDAPAAWTAMRPVTRIAHPSLARIAVPGARSAPKRQREPAKASERSGYQGQEPLGWFDLSVRDGWRTLASYGITRDERALTLTLIARQLSGRDRGVTPPERLSRRADDDAAELPTVGEVTKPSVTVPVPLSDAALEPGVVRVFLDALVEHHPPSAAITSIVDQARAGTFVMTTADANTSGNDELTLGFIRGLAALQKRSFAEAAGWFQQTLRGASDFLGAAYYLGACHAARGQDREAVGAWQMSLLSEGGDVAYPVLVDALLRLGDGPKALEFLEEAPDAWPDADARLRREAVVQAMLGRYPEATAGLTPLLSRHPGDLDLLFVAIQVLYRTHLDSPLSPEERTTFMDYAGRYEQAAGPQIALVDAWRRYVGR